MNRRNTTNLLLGIALVLIGGIALLSKLNVISADIGDLWRMWWPMILILLGVVSLIVNPRSYVGALVVIGFGAIFQISRFDIFDVGFWGLFWPVALTVAGIAILVRALGSSKPRDQANLSSFAFWSGRRLSSTSPDFRSGSFTSIMGGTTVDLRAARIVESAEIGIFSFWGGTVVKVPPTWRVEVRGLPLAGGWTDHSRVPADPNAPVLRVNITCIMGGAQIRN